MFFWQQFTPADWSWFATLAAGAGILGVPLGVAVAFMTGNTEQQADNQQEDPQTDTVDQRSQRNKANYETL